MMFWVVLSVIWGLFVTVFWMVIGYRAMKAHEKIADQAEHYVHGRPVNTPKPTVPTQSYECPKCNMISKETTVEGNCPHCGTSIDR